MTARRIPPNFFGFAFGLAGLGETWAVAANDGLVPRQVATGLAALSGAVWLVVVVRYLQYAATDRSVARRDLLDPVAAPFVSLVVITPMLWAVVGVAPYARVAGTVIFDVFAGLTVVLGGWLTGQWIYGQLDLDKLHPAYFLPTVAGGLVAADGAALLGQHTFAEAAFGLGMISWLVLGSLILNRLFFRPQLPTPLLPTLAIEVAPAAVATLAWLDTHGDRVDTVAAFLGGYGLLMVIAQLRLLPLYLRLPFMPSTWAFTFSWAAAATAALHWLADERPAGHRAEEYLVLAAVTALVGAIAARTALAISRRQLFPTPPAAHAPTALSAPKPATTPPRATSDSAAHA